MFFSSMAAMWDLATDATSHELINEFYAHNKIVSAVCHGPAALANVKLPSGEYLIAGQAVTGFSNSEEDAVGLSKFMPFMLQDALEKNSGGKFVKADDWAKKVVVSRGGLLITGQNPASAEGVGQAIYDGIFGELTTKDEL
jgi:putative intracellular protease/amidase